MPSAASTSRTFFRFPPPSSTPCSPPYFCHSLFPQFRFPTVLLLSVPVTTPPLSPSRIDDHMLPYTSDLISMKRSIAANQHHADPFRCLVDVDALLPPPPAGPSVDASEWYVETVEDGIDQALFPRTMGYLVLESQYRRYEYRISRHLGRIDRSWKPGKPSGGSFWITWGEPKNCVSR